MSAENADRLEVNLGLDTSKQRTGLRCECDQCQQQLTKLISVGQLAFAHRDRARTQEALHRDA